MKKFYLAFLAMASYFFAIAQSPVPMASQPGLSYTETFGDIANWSNGFTSGSGASRFSSVALNVTGIIPSGTRVTTATTNFAVGTGGGVQKGTNNILLLSTGATDNSSSTAIDFLMDFTGVNAGTLSFDYATVFNSTGDRNGSLRVYYSTDGSTFTELTGAQVLNFTNNIAASGSKSLISLPAAFNNSPTARLRFYYHNGIGGTGGSRPKISIDNLTVTATPAGNTISVAAGSDAAEPATAGSFVINFSTPTSGATDVNYDFTGSGVFGTDYTIAFSAGTSSTVASSGTLTVPAGTSSVTITITPVDDATVESSENILLGLSAPTAGYSIGSSSATISLLDNDVAPTVSVTSGLNGAEPAINGTFTITLSVPAPAGGVIVGYSLAGTALAGSDYSNASSGTVTIPEGTSSVTLPLATIDDAIIEGTETIEITLNSASSPYTIASSNAVINLTDNDTAPLSFSGVYTQDFNSLASTGNANAWTNNSTLPGWYSSRVSYSTSDGSTNAGSLYSFGTTSTTERSLGTIGSGSTGPVLYGLRLQNNTGAPITSLKIVYKGEQWRNGGNASPQTVNFSYQTGASVTSLNSGTWTNVANLNFTSPVTGASLATLVGDLPANSAVINYTISGLNIPVGNELMIRWEDIDHGGNDHGLSIDSFYIEANPVDLTNPVLTGTNPVNGASNVAMNFMASINFDEAIKKGTGNIIVRLSSDNSVVQTIDVNTAAVSVSGTSASFALSLASNSSYYIEIDNGAIEDLAGNDFGISGNSTWAFSTGSLFYSADFNSCATSLSDGFTQYSVTGAITWACNPFGRDPANPAGTAQFPYAVQVNGFSNSTNSNVPNVDWLISPSFDLTGTTFPLLSFWSRTAFNGRPLQLKISTDYTGGDPALDTWSDLNGKFPMQASNVWVLSSNINLSAYKHSNVHIAFVYTSTDDDGARWTIDDLRLDNSSTPPPPSLTTSITDMQFSYVAAGSSSDKTFSFTANDITGDVTVTSGSTFLISKDGTIFSNSLTYTLAEANNVEKTIYVRFSPSSNGQEYSGTVSVSTSDLTNTINLKGSSIDPATTLEVVNWNIEWFGHTGNGPTNEILQEQNVKTIFENIGADIYGLLEVVDTARLGAVVRQLPGYSYVVSDFGSHTNTTVNPASALAEAQKLAFVYKTSVFTNITTEALVSQGINSAADISNPAYNYFSSGRFPYMFTADVTLNCITKKVRFVLVHAKANTSPTATSYDRRKKSVDTLHYTLNQLYPNDNIVILGDLNDDLDQSITAGFTTTSWSAFTTDESNYEPVTLPLSLAGKKSTVSYNDVIDHVIISNDMEEYYMNSTANILSDVSSLVSNYGSTTSDHYPVFTRYRFGNPTTAPSITNCPVVAPLCANAATNVTVPAFTATAACGTIQYSYVISGATERAGNTNDASGNFNIGTSIITWTVTDEFGNTNTCETSVTVRQNPTVLIPDVMAMSSGVNPNTVYRGYPAASSVTLIPTVTGSGLTYSWNGGLTTETITVSPATTTTYNLTVTDANGCQASASKQIKVVNVSGIKNPDKVMVCHNGNSLEITSNSVQEHIAHGDMLGSCSTNSQTPSGITVSALPNPSTSHFLITIENWKSSGKVSLNVVNSMGRIIEKRNNMHPNQSFTIGESYLPGIYIVEVSQGDQKTTVRIMKVQN